jgi:Holliday junction resolvasome RuvABC endonuclease subunit
MSVRTYLTLDMALRTGWAYGSTLGPERWGAFDVHKVFGLGPRFVAWREYLRQLIEECAPGEIWVEKPIGVSGASVELSRGFQTIVLLEACPRGISVNRVPASTLKKAITGNGFAGKLAMLQAAQAWLDRCGVSLELDPGDYDAADAVCLLLHATRAGGQV